MINELTRIQRLIEAALNDKRERYVYTLQTADGEVKGIENRESFLQSIMEIASEELDLLIGDLEQK